VVGRLTKKSVELVYIFNLSCHICR
jgi:hypothetical protein